MAGSGAIAFVGNAFDVRINTTASMPIGLYREVPLRLDLGPAELKTLLRALARQPPDDSSRLADPLLDSLDRSGERSSGG
jgi:type IV secretory pathway protease TraF